MFPSRACFVSILALLVAVPAAAQIVDGTLTFSAVTGVRSDDVLNVRVAPNARSRRIGSIPHNARGIKTYGCPSYVTFAQWKRMTQAQKDYAQRRRWCKVEYDGVKGWVAGRFLKEDRAN